MPTQSAYLPAGGYLDAPVYSTGIRKTWNWGQVQLALFTFPYCTVICCICIRGFPLLFTDFQFKIRPELSRVACEPPVRLHGTFRPTHYSQTSFNRRYYTRSFLVHTVAGSGLQCTFPWDKALHNWYETVVKCERLAVYCDQQ